MSNLGTGANTVNSALQAAGQKMNDHASNLADKSISGKEHFSYLTNSGGYATPYSYTPGGIGARCVAFIDRTGTPTAMDDPMHCMVNGRGLIPVSSASTINNATVRGTGVGTFTVDKNGLVANHLSQYLTYFPTDSQGNPINADITTVANLTVIDTKTFTGDPQATTNIGFKLYLPNNAPAAIGTQVATTSFQVYDSLGLSHNLNVRWEKVAQNAADQTWRAIVTTTDANIVVNAPYAAGVDIIFDDHGRIQTIAGAPAAAPNLGLTVNNGAANMVVSMDFGSIGTTNGVSPLGAAYNIREILKDGRTTGAFKGLTIDVDGFVKAHYSNGTSEIKGRVPIMLARSINNLIPDTDSTYIEGAFSGPLTLQWAGTNGSGNFLANNVEGATTDSAKTLTEMPETQFYYISNTKYYSYLKELYTAIERNL